MGEMQPLFLWFPVKVQLWRENQLAGEGSLLLDRLVQLISTSEEMNEKMQEEGEGNLQLMVLCW